MTPRLPPGSFYGDARASYRAGDLFLGESCYAPRSAIPLHEHARSFCCLVLEGHGTEACDGHTRPVGPSTLLFHPAGHAHADCWPSGGRCFHIEFGSPWRDRVREHAGVLEQPARFDGGPMVWLAARLYDELRGLDGVSHLAIEGLALELIASGARAAERKGHRRPPAWLRRAEELLAARFQDPPALGEVAAVAGVHPVHLATVFRRHLGCTPGDYVRRRRVEFACDRLVAGEPLIDVALRAGFADQSHFCRVFKALTGMTPTAYRRLFGRRPKPRQIA